MTEMLYYAHSGLRYLVLLAGIVAFLFLLWGWATRAEHGRGARIALMAFLGLLDVQIVLGLLLLATGLYYPALIGHIMTMILGAAAGHGFSVMSRKSPEPRTRYAMGMMAVGVALALVAAGIMAIGRGPFESRPPGSPPMALAEAVDAPALGE